MPRKRVRTGRTVWQRKDGRWETSISLPKLNGKRRKRSVYGRTAEECAEKAQQAAALTLRRASTGSLSLADPRTRIEDYMETWITKLAEKSKLSPLTLRHYRSTLDVHILPTIGKLRLSSLTVDHVQDWVDTLADSGLGASSVHQCRSVLRSALQPLVGRILVLNPAENVEMPSIKKKQRPYLTIGQAQDLARLIFGHEHEHLWLTMLYSGLRIGEALGLRWQDIDLEARTLTVAVQLQVIAGEHRLVQPKSEKSRATLPLTSFVVEHLRTQELRQKENRLASGSRWRKSGLVFTSTSGQPLCRETVANRLRAVLRGSDLPRLTAHSLRHSTGSVLCALGVHIKVVQEIMRHANFQLTADTYTHVPSELTREAMDRVDRRLK